MGSSYYSTSNHEIARQIREWVRKIEDTFRVPDLVEGMRQYADYVDPHEGPELTFEGCPCCGRSDDLTYVEQDLLGWPILRVSDGNVTYGEMSEHSDHPMPDAHVYCGHCDLRLGLGPNKAVYSSYLDERHRRARA